MNRIFTEAESSRYSRQMVLPELGVAGQRKLKQSRVGVVGAGGLGCPVLTYLAAAGVGKLTIVDGDVVELSNLHRQPLYSSTDVGTAKAEAAAKRVQAINPHVRALAITARLTTANAEQLLCEADLIIDGTDNFAAKYLLNDACVQLGLPLVYGSIDQFQGHLSVFNAVLIDQTSVGGRPPALLPNRQMPRRGPTYRCLFPEPPPVDLVPSCAEAGVLGVLPGLVGVLQATEAIKILGGIGTPLIGKLLIVDALTLQFTTLAFERNEQAIAASTIQSAEYYESLLSVCQTPIISAGVNEVSKSDLLAWRASGRNFLLVDVRERDEKQKLDLGQTTCQTDCGTNGEAEAVDARVDFCGKLVPLGELSQAVSTLPRDIPIVLYCHSGKRSQLGAEQLRAEFGLDNVYSLRGGASHWKMS